MDRGNSYSLSNSHTLTIKFSDKIERGDELDANLQTKSESLGFDPNVPSSLASVEQANAEFALSNNQAQSALDPADQQS